MKKAISNIAHIQPFVQEYAETITDVLELYVTIIDEECIRIGGTGPSCRKHRQADTLRVVF
ncbi:MAG: hypothetical protein K0R22_1229 [Sporomusa sp.]|jgi:hypothetical protein|nr:hypothetical protein [Sporomusa sp.]